MSKRFTHRHEKPLRKQVVGKKTRQWQEALIQEIKAAAARFKSALVVKRTNDCNKAMKDVQALFRPSRMIHAKNTLVQFALGMTHEKECEVGIHKLAHHISDRCSILFTDMPVEEAVELIEEYTETNWARCGNVATETVEIPSGTEALKHMPWTLEPYLRKNGLPTELVNGKINMRSEFRICKEGEAMTKQEANLLKLLDKKMGTFQMKVEATWTRPDDEGSIEIFEKDESFIYITPGLFALTLCALACLKKLGRPQKSVRGMWPLMHI